MFFYAKILDFCKNVCFWVKNAFFLQPPKLMFVKNPKFTERLLHGIESCIQNFKEIYRQIT